MISIDELYQVFLSYPIITTDSRNCTEGSIFFALKGDRFDGNLYAQLALDNGCAYSVVDDVKLKGKPKMLLVGDVLKTLQLLASKHRIALGIPIIGITGTNGKTTTKELISVVLKEKFIVNHTKGNLNNHIGVPLTLLSMNADTQIGVVEMGANHIGEIAELCQIALPNYGLITNIGKAHIEGFGSFEGVIQTKSELYQFIRKNNGVIFRNESDAILKSVGDNIKSFSYSIESDSEGCIYASNIEQDPYLNILWNDIDRSQYHLNTKIIGGYNAINIMAAICVGRCFDVSPEKINSAIMRYCPENNRSQMVNTASNQILLDAYNANPSSMSVALTNFETLAHPKKVVILGSMKELGSISEDEHQLLCDSLNKMSLNEVYLVGDEFFQTNRNPNYKCFANTLALIEYLSEKPIKDALILVKGSRSNALEKILPNL